MRRVPGENQLSPAIPESASGGVQHHPEVLNSFVIRYNDDFENESILFAQLLKELFCSFANYNHEFESIKNNFVQVAFVAKSISNVAVQAF